MMNHKEIKVNDWQKYISDGVNDVCRERITRLIRMKKHHSKTYNRELNKEIARWKTLLKAKP